MHTDRPRITEPAPAKVNLALHVLRRRPDGYHELDSLVAFVPQVADALHLAPARDFVLDVSGPQAGSVPTDDSNLALRAARAMHRRWPEAFGPVRITLEKHLPAAAGIGGGSADAAAVMRAMCRLYRAAPPEEDLRALALELGADVPVCLHGRAARMRGIGERLEPVALPPGLAILLANPGVEVSTARVFSCLAGERARAGRGCADGLPSLPAAPGPKEFIDHLQGLRNDLQSPATTIAPVIADCLASHAALPEVRLVRMSGSGATCFALFCSLAEAGVALEVLRKRHPDWWCALGMLI